MSSYKAPVLPQPFIWRRLHSLLGLWLVLFLIEHLFVNSQAALLVGDDGMGFIRAANAIREWPFLPVVEVVLLGIPFVIHGCWGVKYLLTAVPNSSPSDGSKPALPQYRRNKAYTWQRITSWLLLFGVIAHVIHMRWIQYPDSERIGTEHLYMIRLDNDSGLEPLSKRLGFDVYDSSQLPQLQERLGEKNAFSKAMLAKPLKDGQVVAVAPSFGLAELLMVRDTFKMPIMIALYSIFVLAACFHAFNGVWTFLITWGISLTTASQRIVLNVATFLMALFAFLGLAAIWMTYWINLKG